MRVPNKQAAHRILLMLCVIFCVCLLLTRPVNETQPEDTGAHNVVPIPQGMKVITVPVSDKTIPDKSLLYPGCYVDILTTWKLNNSKIPEAIPSSYGDVLFTLELNNSKLPKVIPDFMVDVLVKCKLIRKKQVLILTTMLRQIQVLSIKRGVRGTFVNLIVDPKEAEALSLAKKNGSISLSVRKPFDEREPKQLDKIRLSPSREFNVIRGPTIQSTHSE